MFSDCDLLREFDCRHVVTVRWNQEDKKDGVPNSRDVIGFLLTFGYSLGNQQDMCFSFSPNSQDNNQFIILPMASEDEARRISNDSVVKGFGINSTRISVHLLLGVNGFCIQDTIDFMKTAIESFNNNELLDLLMIILRLELPDRLQMIKASFDVIKAGIDVLIEDADCEIFGSFASDCRRTGFSDIDINVKSNGQSRGFSSVRPVQEMLANPKALNGHPLTIDELAAYSNEDTIKIMYRALIDNENYKKRFEVNYVPARTPIVVFKGKNDKDLNISFDISVNNQKSVDKATLLDEFVTKDSSEENKMRKAMFFIGCWAKTNKLLPGPYWYEKLEQKTNLNSYIFNHLIIHFVQAASDRILVHPQAKKDSRIEAYNFDILFGDFISFLREFFKYYASFDFTTKAIYGKQAMQKTTLSKVHGAKITPLMMMDPMDCTHNISAKVTEEAVKRLNGLIRNALYILKQKKFSIVDLLETNQKAVSMMKTRETKITVTNKILDGVEKAFISVNLPDIIQSSDDLMILLTRVLRFDVSPDYDGPSVTDLQTTKGVVFTVQSRTWIGRRNKKRQLKVSHPDLTPIQLDVMCSDTYHYEEQPIALLRVCMPNTSTVHRLDIEMLRGQTTEIRDAMHYLIDQFVLNNMDALIEHGISCISSIPSLEIEMSM